ADPDVGVLGADAPGQVERRVDVARLLHVDPHEVAQRGRPGGQGAHVGEAALGVDVEAELGRLDGDLRVDPAGADAFQGVEIMGRHRVRFAAVGDALAQTR